MNADNSFSSLDLEAIEELYKKYLENSDSVDESFKYFFQGFDLATANFPIKPGGSYESEGKSKKEINVLRLINGYRRRGHLFTKTNPVRERRSYSPTLDLENFGLSDADLDVEFQAGDEVGLGRAKLRDIIALLQETYCASIGVEYRYMTKPEKVTWLQEKM
ncbi:MAG: 2-oxoglutarate dehydrogenase E1 subunit family protein [Fermentimonas sp.]|jgi:2-oxoglutarate dehydrogenase E1 component